jgi:hypothetical protein
MDMAEYTGEFIFRKSRNDTFQGPTTVGAAMVLFPLLSLILALMCYLTGWPYWWILVWWLVLMFGKFIPARYR